MDIKSFYASISRHKLISDICAAYDDEKVCNMLARIINNPIEVPNGIRNPDYGIALREPLSQFFGALYLKPLDDTLSKINVFYARYNDDCLLLCKTKRQLVRAKRKIFHVLRERRLMLSSKKSRIGLIDSGFHFLGAQFLVTRHQENTTTHHLHQLQENACILTRGARNNTDSSCDLSDGIAMQIHPRTLRRAREQVRLMVIDGASTQTIKNYLHRFALKWAKTSMTWSYGSILRALINSCHCQQLRLVIANSFGHEITALHIRSFGV